MKKEETKYEVSITVTYNAVSIREANVISKDAIERHKTACTNLVLIKKVSEGSQYLITGTTTIGEPS